VFAEYEPYRRAHLSMHQMGSCRMGSSPPNSVTDGQGHCWDVAGLYVADASCFPTASGTVTNIWLIPSLCHSHNKQVTVRQTCAVAHGQWHHFLAAIHACISSVLLLTYATLLLLCGLKHVLTAAWWAGGSAPEYHMAALHMLLSLSFAALSCQAWLTTHAVACRFDIHGCAYLSISMLRGMWVVQV